MAIVPANPLELAVAHTAEQQVIGLLLAMFCNGKITISTVEATEILRSFIAKQGWSGDSFTIEFKYHPESLSLHLTERVLEERLNVTYVKVPEGT